MRLCISGCLQDDLRSDSEQLRIIQDVSYIMNATAELDNGFHGWKYVPSKKFREFELKTRQFKEVCFKYIHASLSAIEAKERRERETGTCA